MSHGGSSDDTPPVAFFAALSSCESSTDPCSYTVCDGTTSGPSTVTITVNGTNDNSEVSQTLTNQSFEDSQAISFDTALGFSDVDASDVLTFSAIGLPTGLSIDSASGIISGTIDNSASQSGTNGVYTVIVFASDGVAAPVQQEISFTISNPAPVAVDAGERAATRGCRDSSCAWSKASSRAGSRAYTRRSPKLNHNESQTR